MTTFPGSPRLFKGSIILLDSQTSRVERTIILQYNPHTLTRTLQPQGIGDGNSGDRSEVLRLKGPPVETISLEAEIDATDQLEFPRQNQTVTMYGIMPQLAILEMLVYPESSRLTQNHQQAQQGLLEIRPVEVPLTIFVWNQTRALPVRLTEFKITEEAFDHNLNPLQAKINLNMRVLSVNDLGFEHTGGDFFMTYHRNLESMAAKHPTERLNRGILL